MIDQDGRLARLARQYADAAERVPDEPGADLARSRARQALLLHLVANGWRPPDSTDRLDDADDLELLQRYHQQQRTDGRLGHREPARDERQDQEGTPWTSSPRS